MNVFSATCHLCRMIGHGMVVMWNWKWHEFTEYIYNFFPPLSYVILPSLTNLQLFPSRSHFVSFSFIFLFTYFICNKPHFQLFLTMDLSKTSKTNEMKAKDKRQKKNRKRKKNLQSSLILSHSQNTRNEILFIFQLQFQLISFSQKITSLLF